MTDPLIGFEDDKKKKIELIKEVILTKASHCDVEILQRIDRVCGEGAQLHIITLSGGYTNYSYKISVLGHSDLVVFAKLSFEYALWNPDKKAYYDLKRTVCEYEIMDKMAKNTPGCVVSPLACFDVEDEGQRMKLLLTEWSEADEQLCNQFIDGAVDPRIAPQLARVFKTLHTIEFDPNFNEQVKPCMLSLFDQVIEYAKNTCEQMTPKDRTEKYMVVLGSDLMQKILLSNLSDYNTRDCLIHSDSHVFNIIVEAKPSVEELQSFGPKGNLVLVDWEMCMAGPTGRDLGLALSFPIGCRVAHALQGHSDADKSINAFIISLIDNYAKCMSNAGKSDEVSSILRNAAGWAGWFMLFAFYFLDAQMVAFPCATEHDRKYVRDSMGVLGLKLLRLSYDTDYFPNDATTTQVKKMFRMLVEEQVTETSLERAMHKRRMQPRKSSMLRAANRRVSDTLLNFGAVNDEKCYNENSVTEQ